MTLETYRRCERCRCKIHLYHLDFQWTAIRGVGTSATLTLCRRCSERPKHWQGREPNAYRHAAMVIMRDNLHLTLQQIGTAFGLDHSTILHHLKADCRCDMGIVV